MGQNQSSRRRRKGGSSSSPGHPSTPYSPRASSSNYRSNSGYQNNHSRNFSSASASSSSSSSSYGSYSSTPQQQYRHANLHSNQHQQQCSRGSRGSKGKSGEGPRFSPVPEKKPNSAVEWKEFGNRKFASDDYKDAIQAYTSAIGLDATDPVFFTNRALCHLRLNDHGSARNDAAAAVRLDPRSVKGHYLGGMARLHVGEYTDAKACFRSALSNANSGVLGTGISKRITPELRHEIVVAMQKARRLEWEASHVSGTLLEKFRSEAEGLLRDKFKDMELEYRLDILEAVSRTYVEATSPGREADVPEYLCCPLTYEIMKFPMMAPSGQSYDKAAIFEWVDEKHQDPMTRKPLSRSDLRPNIALRHAIEAFIEANPWCTPEEDESQINT